MVPEYTLKYIINVPSLISSTHGYLIKRTRCKGYLIKRTRPKYSENIREIIILYCLVELSCPSVSALGHKPKDFASKLHALPRRALTYPRYLINVPGQQP